MWEKLWSSLIHTDLSARPVCVSYYLLFLLFYTVQQLLRVQCPVSTFDEKNVLVQSDLIADEIKHE